jgi:hypothetical protein
MLQISAQQLAELLSGIARAMTGAKSTHIMPALGNVAHLRDRPQATLVDLPVRILMSYESRVGPDLAAIQRDLERLLGGGSAPAAPAAPAAQDAGGDMDFSNLGGKS